MADIVSELITEVSGAIAGPPQPGEPQVVMGPAAEAGEMHVEMEAGG